ncbi:hypothetical protein JCM1840_004090 [Sporobolomyces johnsonii]
MASTDTLDPSRALVPPIDLPPQAQPSTSPVPSPSPSPSNKRSFLSKIPVGQLKRIPRPPRPSRLVPFRGNAQQRRVALFQPLKDGDEPLGTLVIRVHAARDLVAKDRNGLSDPYCVIRYGPARATSPTVPKSLNPVWGSGGESGAAEGAGGEAKLELKVYESLGLARERIEIICWDRDRLKSEYLGEVSLGVGDWWGSAAEWKEGKPPVGFFDEDNKPVWHTLRSSRSRSTVSGALLVQIGFVPISASGKGAQQLPQHDRDRIYGALLRIAEETESARRASREDRVLLTSPTEGVGTRPIDESTPLGATTALPHDLDSDSSGASDSEDEDSESETENEEEEEEYTSTVAETSTDDEDEFRTAVEAPRGYFDSQLSSTQSLQLDQAPSSQPSTSPLVSPVPSIVVGDSSTQPDQPSSDAAAGPPPTAPPVHRRLSIAGFLKRRVSQQSAVSTITMSADSDLNSTDMDSSASVSASPASSKERKKRFARKKKQSDITVDEGLLGAGMMAGEIATPTQGRGKGKKARRQRVEGEGQGQEGIKKKRTGKGKAKGKDYTYEEGEDIAGLVQIEIKGAKNLPRFKNAFRTSYDMDPFCVISFGRKIFRTRVIRHSLTPVWEERLFFHVRPAETHWNINFSVLDWDKFSGNDHVGNVTVALEQLLGSTIQPDERGLYAAGSDGKLAGDYFHEHDLPLVIEKGEKDAEYSNATLSIRAKYTPYAALRQQFWRLYARQHDIDDSGSLSQLELFSMLDSLGSTLTRDTVESFFTRHGRTINDELTMDEVLICLEDELHKPKEERRTVDTSDSGLNTPGIATPGGERMGITGGLSAGTFTDREETSEPGKYAQTDMSSNMKTLAPGTEVLTDPERGTTVKAPFPDGSVRPPPSRQESIDPYSDDSSPGPNVERVINIKSCPLCQKPRLSKKGELDIVTHLGICSSTDPASANRFLVSNYVTASQAQRKFFSKVISKVTNGSYGLGADSANIIVQDRQTGALLEEKIAVYVRLGIRLMYRGMGSGGGMESARVRRLLESLTIKQGAKYDSPASQRDIEPFIRFHSLNLEEMLDPLSSFKTFNEFFYRKLKPEARPLADPDDPRTLVSPADCRAMFFETIDDATSIWIKGREFTIGRMLGDHYKDKAKDYEGGSLAIFRLAPQDYHRYHSPVDGTMGYQDYIKGAMYTVNTMAIRSPLSIYTENVRLVSQIDSPVFGETMHVWVGAMMVASIKMTKQENEEVKRGDELGYFAFGGSTIVVLFKPGTVVFDPDLLENSRHAVETLIRVKTRIGRALEKPN